MMEQWKRNVYICTLAAFITSAGMSQLAPMLPLYIQSLGVDEPGQVARWAGIVFAMNFVTLAIFSPIWGRLSDRYGRKIMCLRAVVWLGVINFGMGMAQQVWHLVVLRLMQGALSGFLATAMPLVSSESPKKRAGWALGLFFTGQISGSLIGPLLGGWLAETVGFRNTYFVVGVMCFFSSLAILGIHETRKPVNENVVSYSNREAFRSLARPSLLYGIFLTTFTFQFSLMCVQPILTVYIAGLVPESDHIALISGAVFSSAGFASALFGSRLGALSDRIGAQKVLFCSLLVACLVSVPHFCNCTLAAGISALYPRHRSGRTDAFCESSDQGSISTGIFGPNVRFQPVLPVCRHEQRRYFRRIYRGTLRNIRIVLYSSRHADDQRRGLL